MSSTHPSANAACLICSTVGASLYPAGDVGRSEVVRVRMRPRLLGVLALVGVTAWLAKVVVIWANDGANATSGAAGGLMLFLSGRIHESAIDHLGQALRAGLRGVPLPQRHRARAGRAGGARRRPPGAVADAAKAQNWAVAGTQLEGLRTAWTAVRGGDVPAQIRELMDGGLTALATVVAARDQAAAVIASDSAEPGGSPCTFRPWPG